MQDKSSTVRCTVLYVHVKGGFLKRFYGVRLVFVHERAFRVLNSALGPLKRVTVAGTNFKIRKQFIEKKCKIKITKRPN
jgi:hypothetical protein